MTEGEKLLRKAGAVLVERSKHNIYILDGHRFSLHKGGRPNRQEIYTIKRNLRRLERERQERQEK